MPTETTLVNSALRLLGLPVVSDAAEETTRARELRAALPEAVLSCLSETAWNHAESLSSLALLAEVPAAMYAYYYQLPADFVRMNWISAVGRKDSPLHAFRNQDGRIATDASTVYLAYVSNTYAARIGSWPQPFADYVSAEMAKRTQPTLAPGEGHAQRLAEEWKRAKSNAVAFDAAQNPIEPNPPGRWSTARLGGSRTSEHG